MQNYEHKFLENDHLIKNHRLYDGVQYIFDGHDDYYFSVVKHQMSDGNESGLYELAKYQKIGKGSHLVDEPIGWLTADEVLEIVKEDNNVKKY